MPHPFARPVHAIDEDLRTLVSLNAQARDKVSRLMARIVANTRSIDALLAERSRTVAAAHRDALAAAADALGAAADSTPQD